MTIKAISLIGVFYNEAHRVEEWVNNAKTYGVDEIIVVDQSSTDGTAEMLEDAGVMVLHDECRGYGEASRPMAWEKAEGPWVLQLDADEHLSDEFLADLRECDQFTQHRQGVELIVGGVSHGRQGSIFRFVPKANFRCPDELHTCFMPHTVLSPSMGCFVPHYACIIDSKSWTEALDGEMNYERLGLGPSPQRRGIPIRTPFLSLARLEGLTGPEIDAMDVAERERLGFKPGGGIHL